MSITVPSGRRLLLVDADDVTRRALAEQLCAQGYPTATAGSWGDVRRALGGTMLAEGAAGETTDGPAAVLVGTLSSDVAPEGVGDFCRRLREQGFRGAMLVLGVPPEGEAGVRAAGAAGCVAKPFRLSALLQKLGGALRDLPQSVRLAGGIEFQIQARRLVEPGGRVIRLTEKEAAVIHYLHRAIPRVVTREELLGEVWKYAGGADTHTVETHIYRLRRKSEAVSALLLTEAGGYRLAATSGPSL